MIKSMNRFLPFFFFVILAIIISGCPPAHEVKKEEPPPLPVVKKPPVAGFDITIGSLNISRLSKRIEQTDVRDLADLLSKEKIDILTIEGLSRYPDIASRVDIVDELAREAEMHHAFGETINISGRQGGNAILSLYPIRSNENTHYEGIRSNGFEAALLATIDCGVADVVVVVTLLPEKTSPEDLTVYTSKLNVIPESFPGHPIIISGNLPNSGTSHSVTKFETVPVASNDTPTWWYSSDSSLKFLGQDVRPSSLGTVVMARFSIFDKPKQ